MMENKIAKHTSDFNKRNIQRQYLRNGDLKLSDGTNREWESANIEVDITFDGVFSMVDDYLNYSTTKPLDLYQYIYIDSTPENLMASIPIRLNNKINFVINSDGDFVINIV